MRFKPEINGAIGESLTRAILLEYFFVSERTPDIEGADFLVELRYDSLEQFRVAKNKISVRGIVQSKFFEGNNEVKIAREYVEDIEGIRTDFFAMLHSNDKKGNAVIYFFTAKDIVNHWKFRADSAQKKEYYIFSISRNRRFNDFKNLPKIGICQRIENGIYSTEEYKNEKLIRQIEEGFRRSTISIFEESNHDLFKRIKNYHIVDKLYEALSSCRDFKTMIPWRVVDKISFKEKHSTITSYNQFTLNTNNSEIITFFNSIEISTGIKLIKSSFFKGIKDAKRKVEKIVEVLNENGVVWFQDRSESKPVSIKRNISKVCECLKCTYYQLNLPGTLNGLNQKKFENNDLWDKMQGAYANFLLGDFEKAKNTYQEIYKTASENKEEVLKFIAKYNLRLCLLKTWDNSLPDLKIELDQLYVGPEKRRILNSLSTYSLVNDYANSIDELYLKVKDYKQRKIVNNTANLVNRLYAKIAEYHIFMEGNFLLENAQDKYEQMVEKVIESFIVSHSMKTDYTCHAGGWNDFLVRLALHNCDPGKLYSYFQRNKVNKIDYEEDADYLNNCLTNFFSKENVDYLQSRITIKDSRTEYPELRRKVGRLFENLCILISHLNAEIHTNRLLDSITYFIENLDYNVHDVSRLAHPLLGRPELFTVDEVLHLTSTLIEKKDFSRGYLITNCVYCLQKKDYLFERSQIDLVKSLIKISLNDPKYGLLGVLSNVLSETMSEKLKSKTSTSLKDNFTLDLYYEAVINKCINDPATYFDTYKTYIEKYIENKTDNVILFNTNSPYTGLSWSLSNKLNDFVEIVYSINDHHILKSTIAKKVAKEHPYYNFLLNIDSFKRGDPFKVEWLLENTSDIILQRLCKNINLKKTLRTELEKSYNSEVGKLYVRYFT